MNDVHREHLFYVPQDALHRQIAESSANVVEVITCSVSLQAKH